MNPAPTPNSSGNGATSAHELFALTDEQILQIEPDAQDIEIFAGERSDPLDPLREDLDLLVSGAPAQPAAATAAVPTGTTTGAAAVAATNADTNAVVATQNPSTANAANASATSANTANDAPPAWLAARMNDAQHGAEARELWQSTQAARQEASAFREVFAKPEEARAAAARARMLDEIDGAYFGAPGLAPEQISTSRAQLAAVMLREDPAAFREMVYTGLRALEAADQASNVPGDRGEQGSTAQLPRLAQAFRGRSNENVTASHSEAPSPAAARSGAATTAPASSPQSAATHAQNATSSADARLAAYAAFERAANDELERGVADAIDRSLEQALPNAARTEKGAALKQRLSSAIRQDVEQSLQGDRALGEQVARILAGQRLDAAARAQVVRLIGDRAQQLIPTAARRVLADWTQTTLSTHSAATSRRGEANAAATNSGHAAPASRTATSPPGPATTNAAATPRHAPAREARRNASQAPSSRKIDYRHLTDDDILNS
jgi:hypothetical protein